jgi:hypothetical protein
VEALTAATTFATIVGLLSNFKSERNSSSDNEHQEFIEWLDNKRHKSLIDEINSNHLLSLGIKSLLNQNHEIVIKKLKDLDETLLVLSSSIGGFKEISTALAPNIELSEQAISILEQLNSSGGSSFLECKSSCDTEFLLMDTQGSIKIKEARFIDDDLNTLLRLDLLLLDYGSKGSRIFKLTRLAVKLLDQV